MGNVGVEGVFAAAKAVLLVAASLLGDGAGGGVSGDRGTGEPVAMVVVLEAVIGLGALGDAITNGASPIMVPPVVGEGDNCGSGTPRRPGMAVALGVATVAMVGTIETRAFEPSVGPPSERSNREVATSVSISWGPATVLDPSTTTVPSLVVSDDDNGVDDNDNDNDNDNDDDDDDDNRSQIAI